MQERFRREAEEQLRRFMIQMEIDRRLLNGEKAGSFVTVFRDAAGHVTGVTHTRFSSNRWGAPPAVRSGQGSRNAHRPLTQRSHRWEQGLHVAG